MTDLPNNIDLDNPEFQQAWRVLKETRSSVFLTGKAGTGKSTFLKYICNNLGKQHIILAPTGVAAVNVGGMTIHSFFQVPLRPIPPNDSDYSIRRIPKMLKLSRSKKEVIKNIELLVIDEVSMVRPDIIDFVDRVLRSVMRKPKDPFGGKQLLLVGDIFQLEPVVTADARNILSRYYNNCFFFDAVVFRNYQLIPIELKKIYRQTNTEFISLLDRMRVNHTTAEDIHKINSRIDSTNQNYDDDFSITITSRRETADAINLRRLEELPTESFHFKGDINGNFPESALPTPLNLELKLDTQVMLIKNDKQKRWVNGTLARISEINEDGLSICLENGATYNLDRETWENTKYFYDEKEKCVKQEVLGSYIQFPVKAAWAITVHKSQGLTFNKVTIDMDGGAFTAGQTYVALSRCTSLDGITIGTPITLNDIIISGSAIDFSKRFNDRMAFEKALANTKADEAYKNARIAFDDENYTEAVEEFYQGMCYRNDLREKSARRALGMFLRRYSSLQRENERLKAQLKDVATEYVSMGETCISADESLAAEANFEKALRFDPEMAEAQLGMAEVMIIHGENKEAMSMLRPFLKKRNDYAVRAFMLKARIHIENEEIDRALMALSKALKIDDGNADVHEKLSEIYYSLGEEELYRYHLKKVEHINSKVNNNYERKY